MNGPQPPIEAGGVLTHVCFDCEQYFDLPKGRELAMCQHCGTVYCVSWHPTDGHYQGICRADCAGVKERQG